MSAHDLALGLAGAVFAAACVLLGMWLQRAFRDDERARLERELTEHQATCRRAWDVVAWGHLVADGLMAGLPVREDRAAAGSIREFCDRLHDALNDATPCMKEHA